MMLFCCWNSQQWVNNACACICTLAIAWNPGVKTEEKERTMHMHVINPWQARGYGCDHHIHDGCSHTMFALQSAYIDKLIEMC